MGAIDHTQYPERPAWPSRPLRSTRDLMALTVLSFLSEGPHHAYDMERLIRERHKDFALGKPRSLYHAVERLAQDGLIEPLETTREGRRPERTVYRITDEGSEEFQTALGQMLEQPGAEHPQLTVAISFLSYLPVEVALDALRTRAVALEGAIAALDAALRALLQDIKLPRLVLLEHECMRTLKQAELDWVRTIVADIMSGALAWGPELWDELFGPAHWAQATRPDRTHGRDLKA